MEAVDGAELVKLVMDFVEDKRLVVVGGVVADDVVNGVGREEVHNLDPILEIWNHNCYFSYQSERRARQS